MGSKVIGFRVPDDLAEQLERVSGERGMTTADFLRRLVDDALYPPNPERTSSMADTSIEEQLGRLEHTQTWLVDEFNNLSKQIDKPEELKELAEATKGIAHAGDKADEIRSEIERIDRDAKDKHNELARLVNGNIECEKPRTLTH